MDILFEMVLQEVFIVGCVVGFFGGITVGAIYVAWDSRRKK